MANRLQGPPIDGDIEVWNGTIGQWTLTSGQSSFPSRAGGTTPTAAALPFYNVKDFGAVGDGITDDTGALQAALNAGINGATVCFPDPTATYLHGPLVADGATGLSLWGAGWARNYASKLVYTGGAGSGRAWSFRSVNGLKLEGIALDYNNAAYNGDFVDFDHSALASDSNEISILGCFLGGIGGAASARSLLRLNRAIDVHCGQTYFGPSVLGVLGVDGNYSNVVTIDTNCIFNGPTVGGIQNAGQGWLIASCNFEGIGFRQTGGTPQGLTFLSNWFGDGAFTAISFPSTADGYEGLVLIGNFIAPSAGTALLLDSGTVGANGSTVTILGNYISTNVDFGTHAIGKVVALGNNIAGSVLNIGRIQSGMVLSNYGQSDTPILTNQTGTPVYTMTSAGSDYGLIQQDGPNLWSLAHGGSQLALGTPVVQWGFNTLGFYNKAPVAQPARTGQITDNTGGTSEGNALAAAGAAYSQADENNARATITAKLNAIEAMLHNVGLEA
jgi:hypothetical protein